MKITSKRFDFAKGQVTERVREVPDTPPMTPLLALLQKRAGRK